MYLNFDLRNVGHPDWSLARFGAARYAAISGMSRFQGKVSLKSVNKARVLARIKARQQAKARAKARLEAKQAKKQAAETASDARVQKGSAAAGVDTGPVRGQKAKKTKPSRDRSSEPPQTLDRMER